METLHPLYDAVGGVTPQAWGAFFGLIVAALGAIGVTQFIKKRYELETSGTIHFVVASISFATVFMDNLLTALHQSLPQLGGKAAVVWGVATAIFHGLRWVNTRVQLTINSAKETDAAVQGVLNPVETPAEFGA